MDIIIANVANMHGVKGEVKLISQSDFIAERLTPGNLVKIDSKTYTIASYRTHKQFHMVRFEGINTINEVETLKGSDVYQRLDAVSELEADEYHYSDLIGLSVVTNENLKIGRVTKIIETGAKDVLVITGDKEYMIPFVDEFVTHIDIEHCLLTVEPIEGMLE